MKSIPLKKLLAALILLLSPLTMLAQKEAYAVYTVNNRILTFYCDTQRSTRQGTTYDLNTGMQVPRWITDDVSVVGVKFDPSFQDARPTSTYAWFYKMKNIYVLGIQGMGTYLNTSEVTNMTCMFEGCSTLTSLDVSSFNTAKVTNMNSMFSGCSSLTSLDVSSFNTSKVTNMRGMFYGCSSLKSLDVSNFNTENVTNMQIMFNDCSSLKRLDVSGFNTAKVTDMAWMFKDCSALTTIYCDKIWNRSSGLNSDDMFSGCTSLKGGKGTAYNLSNITATYARPDGGTSNLGYFTLPSYAVLSTDGTTLTIYYDNQKSSRTGTKYNLNFGPGWMNDSKKANVTKVVFVSSFQDARPISTSAWFFEMSALTTITGMKDNLNTSEVTDMSFMFFGCSSLTSLDVSGFNTAKVTNMDYMFSGCSKLTSLDVSNFNTANVTDMNSMFAYCRNLTTIYCDKDWKNVTNSTSMFYNCTSLKGGNGTKYNASHTDATYAHLDAADNPGYFTLPPYAALSTDGTTLTFYCDNKRSTRSNTYGLKSGANYPDWDADKVTKVVFDSSFRDARPTSTYAWFMGMENLTSIIGMKAYLNTSEVTNMSYMFWGCYSLTSLDLTGFNTAKVTNMSDMFWYCPSLESLDVSNFNTSNVTDMSRMFLLCSSLKTIYCNDNWNRSGLSSDYMFMGCESLVGGNGTKYDETKVTATYARPDAAGSPGYFTLSPYAALSTDGTTLTFYYDNKRSTRGTTYGLNSGANEPGWYSDGKYKNVTKVVFDSSFRDARPTSTYFWFRKMENLSSIQGMKEYLNTSEVTDMFGMFNGCTSLTSIDLSSFNTENVTTMYGMFENCSSLTSLDVSSFNTAKVTNMNGMFYYCSSLTSLDLSNFNTTAVQYMDYMFFGNSRLTTIICDNDWNRSGITSTDMFYGCESLKGGNGTAFDASHTDATYARPDAAGNPGYFTLPPSAYAALSTDETTLTLTFYYDNKRSTRGTTYGMNLGSSVPGWYSSKENITTVEFDASFKDARPTSTNAWFYGMTNLASITGMKEYLNTSEVTNMRHMFNNCSSLKSLDVSGFNTENVKDMGYMFNNCSSLTSLDVSNFNTTAVQYMDYMFYGNSKLTTIYCNDNWSKSEIISSSSMFYGCKSLKGGNGTVFNSSNVTATYAHPDAADNPGYFTKFVLGDANGDGKVTITDAVAVVNSILGSTQGTFIKRAADVDGNGDISITDAVGIVNIILNSSPAGVKERQVREEVGLEKDPD